MIWIIFYRWWWCHFSFYCKSDAPNFYALILIQSRSSKTMPFWCIFSSTARKWKAFNDTETIQLRIPPLLLSYMTSNLLYMPASMTEWWSEMTNVMLPFMLMTTISILYLCYLNVCKSRHFKRDGGLICYRRKGTKVQILYLLFWLCICQPPIDGREKQS